MLTSREDALAHFAHPSSGVDPEALPEWADYYVSGPLCLAAHPGPWPGLVIVHLGAKPEGRGHLVEHARAILDEIPATRVQGWIEHHNRATIAFARRVGATEIGRTDEYIMLEWRRPCPPQS
jgi:hypothetical protein